MAELKWNESLSDQLKKLRQIKNPSKQQKEKIAMLQGVKANAGKVVTDPNFKPPAAQDPAQTAGSVNDNIQDTGAIANPQEVLDQAGKTFNPNDPYFQNLYKNTYQQNYDLGTAGLAERQARDLEEAKQEAANRGLVYDPSNRESAYGKAIGGVTDRYDDLYKQASNQAYNAANEQYVAQGGLANQGHTAFMQSVLGISAADAAAIANGTASEAVKKDYEAKMAAVRASNKPSGSSGGSQSSSSGGGFQITD